MKILRESTADFRQSLQHPVNVKFWQLNFNYATNQRDTMKTLAQTFADLRETLQRSKKQRQFKSKDATSERVFQVPQPLSTGSSHSPIDISFVVDASYSIEKTAFNDCLRFIIGVIDNFNISPNEVRVSLVTYGYEAYEEHAFGFKRYLDKDRLKRAILAVPYSGGSTNTSEGIRNMLQKHYPESRSEAHHVAIVITDGKSNNMKETAAAATNAQRAYNQVFAIRVGSSSSTSLEELFEIASDRSYVLRLDSDGLFQTIKMILTWKPYKDVVHKANDFSVNDMFDILETSASHFSRYIEPVYDAAEAEGAEEEDAEEEEDAAGEDAEEEDAGEEGDSTKQLEANCGNSVTEMEKKIVVEGSIEHLQERYKKLVTELRKKGNYLEEVKISGQDTMRWLDEKIKRLDSGLKDIARDIDQINDHFKLNPQQINEKDPEHTEMKEIYILETEGLCRTTDELVIRLEDIAKKISGKIASMSRKTDELQESLKNIFNELEKDQRLARNIGKGIAVVLGATGAAVAAVLSGGLLAPLVATLAIGAGSLAISQAAAKYMEKDAFKEAQTHWNGYGRELKGSGLLWIIGQEMINTRERNKHILNAGKAFKEMHFKEDANSNQIAKKYFKERMVAKFIFSGLDFIEFLKWLLSSTDSIEIHLNSFIDTELAGILQALNNMATDIDRN